jgi:hypothetical protein
MSTDAPRTVQKGFAIGTWMIQFAIGEGMFAKVKSINFLKYAL